MRTIAAVLLLCFVLVPDRATFAAPADATDVLAMLLSDVPAARGYRYDAKDDQGVGLDSLKIVYDGSRYLGVYHHELNGIRRVRLASSTNLLDWHFVREIEASASQPTIARLGQSGYVVAYEKESLVDGNHLAFAYYTSEQALEYGGSTRTFDAPRILAQRAEGTPVIYDWRLAPDIERSTITVGFHFLADQGVDRQARGLLKNFRSWVASEDTHLDALFGSLGYIGGNVGDRDHFLYASREYNLHEAQRSRGDFGTWGSYLYDYGSETLRPLSLRTHGHSASFGNGTFTSVVTPSGRPGFVSTQFVFTEGAAPGEAGELIFYGEY